MGPQRLPIDITHRLKHGRQMRTRWHNAHTLLFNRAYKLFVKTIPGIWQLRFHGYRQTVMPKKKLKKWFPTQETIQNHKSLRFLGKLLHDPNLFHLNRKSASRAFFIGLFCAFIPMPFQMALAMFMAIWFHANAPISVGLVWITNPLTMPPIFYFNYWVGTLLLNRPAQEFSNDWGSEAFWSELISVWQPLYLGSLVSAIVFGALGYYIIQAVWRSHVRTAWKKRLLKRKSQLTDSHQ